ncbi:unnamed protein product, partial [marine sediment metagenome]
MEISGFKATGAGAWDYEGWPDGTPVKDRKILAGIYIGEDVTGCNIHDNVLEGNRDGIYLGEGSSGNTFERNNASENYEGFELTQSGIEGSHYNTFRGNIANYNFEYGFRMNSSSYNTFIDNTANHNGLESGEGRGFWAVGGSGNDNNTFTGNTANGNDRAGFQLNMGTGTTFTGNTADGNLGEAVDGDYEWAGIIIDSGEDLADFTMTGNTITGHEIGILIWTVG